MRRIVLINEPILRKKAKKVKSFDAGLKALVDDMVEAMHAANGVGLAAPQVGIPQRIIVVQLPADDEEPEAGKLFVLVNPEIQAQSEDLVPGEEGCLSVPGLVGEVNRARGITLRACNLKGKRFRVSAEGYLARVFQHELDHLEGVLFLDRVEGEDKLRRLTPEGEKEPLENVS